MPRLTFRFRDGGERVVEAAPRASVLDAALAAGLLLDHQCRSGSCGTCVARIVEGALAPDRSRASALLPSEIAAGYQLTCQAVPASDCAFDFDYPLTHLDGPRPLRFTARVRAATRLSQSVIELAIEGPNGLPFAPGQYVRIAVPGTDQWRSYSMASTKKEQPLLRFLIRLLPNGAMSNYIANRCRPGDPLELEGPFGTFALTEPRRPQVMVAGGTGLAPLLALLDQLRATPGLKPPVALCFGCTDAEDYFYADELAARAHWMPNLTLRTAVMTGALPAGAARGTAVDLLDGIPLGSEAIAYLCGPPAMIEAGRTRLLAGGVAPDNIRVEAFRPSEA